MTPVLQRIATTLYTARAAGHVAVLPVVHYGREPVVVSGYAGWGYDLGDVERLLARGGRNMASDGARSGRDVFDIVRSDEAMRTFGVDR